MHFMMLCWELPNQSMQKQRLICSHFAHVLLYIPYVQIGRTHKTKSMLVCHVSVHVQQTLPGCVRVLSTVFLEEQINSQQEGDQTNEASFASAFLSVNPSFFIISSIPLTHPSIHPSIGRSADATTGLSVWWSRGSMSSQTPALEHTSTWRSSMNVSLTVSMHLSAVDKTFLPPCTHKHTSAHNFLTCLCQDV